ncbi:MAG: fibronectin type III domain-containing protein [Acidobacteria bacterium]|nr:fibronectin type III domain-containing protein [Acidobacteriota bacterium]
MHLRRAFISLLTLLALASPGPALADVNQAPRLPWVFDDAVMATRQHGNVLYVGGYFKTVSPAANVGGRFIELSSAAGTPARTFPAFPANSFIYAVVDDGAGGWFVGGGFHLQEPADRNYLLRFRADGTVDPAFAPVLNGPVYALWRSDDLLYVGGDFTQVSGQSRGHAARFQVSTGALTAWAPNVTGTVRAVRPVGNRVFLGGGFTHVNGIGRLGLAAVSALSGGTDGFNLGVSGGAGWVYAFAAEGSTLYVGGDFEQVGGLARQRLAAIDTSANMVLPFFANADAAVHALASNGSQLFVGGQFTYIGGASRRALAAVHLQSGGINPWNPGIADDPGVEAVQALAISGATLYAGGAFGRVSGQPRANLVALSASGNAQLLLPWNPGVDDRVRALAARPGAVVAAGQFAHYGTRAREGLAAVNTITGELLPFAPHVVGGVHALEVAGAYLYVGGSFTAIDGATRNGAAAIDVMTRAVLPWNPDVEGTVYVIRAHGSDVYIGGSIDAVGGASVWGLALVHPLTGARVAWEAGLDTDANVLTMETAGGLMYVGGTFTQIGGQARNRLAAINLATRTVTAFNPNVVGTVHAVSVHGADLYVAGDIISVGGQPRTSAAAVDRATGSPTGFAPALSGSVYDIEVVGSTAYLAGTFTTVNGASRRALAAVDRTSGLVTRPFNPLHGGTGHGRHLSVVPGVLVVGAQLSPEAGFVGGVPPNLQLFPIAGMTGAPGPPSTPLATIAGDVLRLDWSASPLGGPPTDFLVEAAATPGGAAFASLPNGSIAPTITIAGVPPGQYYLRVRARNAHGVSVASPEIGVAAGLQVCLAPPQTPDLRASVVGSSVTLAWDQAVGLATGYEMTAGTTEGQSNIGTFAVGAATTFGAEAPPGVYYTRVVARNACGVSAPSVDVPVLVGMAPPVVPEAAASVQGSTVTVTWPAVPGAVSYRLEAGSGPLLSDVAVMPTGSTGLVAVGVPAGTYYVRVHALTAAGLRSTSRELVVIVP